MKHKITLIVTLVVVASLCYIAIHKHNSHVSQQVSAHTKSVSTQVKAEVQLHKQAQATANELKEVNAANVRLTAQCKLGQVAYSELTYTNKLRLAEPVCKLP